MSTIDTICSLLTIDRSGDSFRELLINHEVIERSLSKMISIRNVPFYRCHAFPMLLFKKQICLRNRLIYHADNWIGGFHITSLKFKLQNYWSSWDLTLMMYNSSWKMILKNVRSEWDLGFVINYTWIFKFLRDAALHDCRESCHVGLKSELS